MSRHHVLCALFPAALALAASNALAQPEPEPPKPVGVMKPIIVGGKIFTLREVIQRATRGERGKLSGHVSATRVLSVRATLLWESKKEIQDQVYRVYEDSTGYRRSVFVRANGARFKLKDGEWVADGAADPDQPEMRVEDFETSTFTRLPLYLREDGEFDFELIERILDGTHVVFHVGFRPRSSFSTLPSGEVHIDSDGFRVIHETYEFTANPAPMFIKGIRRASRQWTHLTTGEWVPLRVAFELDVRNSFGLAPKSVSLVAMFSDYVFDQPYDARLFGETKRDPLPPANYTPPPPDTLYFSSLLERLHYYDDEEYTLGIDPVDTTYTRESIAWHDSLGLRGLPTDDVALDGGDWKLEFTPSLGRWDYNRVEGLVAGGGVRFGQADENRSGVRVFAGYATASEKFRYAAEARWRLPMGGPPMWLSLAARHGVEPFGSNRPAVNSLRALVGGADEQDYLEASAWSIGLRSRLASGIHIGVGYESAEESAREAETDFSFFGDLDKPNLAADGFLGEDHAIVGTFSWDAGSWLQLALDHRQASRDFGGRRHYGRTDARIGLRRFVIGQELRLGVAGATTHGFPTVQRLCDIGGITTVRGYARRTRVGEHSLALRSEYLVPYDPLAATGIPGIRSLHLQFVPWGDAGRVWSDQISENWIRSWGIGVQRLLGPFGPAAILRFDVAVPLDDESNDPVYYLRFESTW